MGRTILTNTNGVVGKNPGNGTEFGKTSNTDSRTEVVNEDKEGRSGDLEKSVVSESVHDGSHSVFTDTEVKILSGVTLVETSSEVSSIVDVVTGRSVKIGRSRNVVGHKAGDFLDNLVSRNTGGFSTRFHGSDILDHIFSRHDVVIDGIVKLLGKIGVGLLPGGEGLLPFIVLLLVLFLDLLEVVAGSFRNIPALSFRDANVELGLFNVWDTGFSVSSVGSLGFFHTLTDDGVALDKLGLSIVGGLGSGDGGLNGLEVVTINVIDFPSVCLVTLQDVLGLSVLGHFVKGDLVGVVHDDKVIKLLVGGEGSGFGGNTLLEASISGKSENVVTEDLVFIGVVNGLSHLFGGGETNGVGNTLSKRTGGALNSGGVVFGVGEFGVTRGHGVVLTEVLEFLHGKIVSGKVEPRVDEHRSVSSRKDEAITVNPLGVLGVVAHLGSVKNGTNFSSSKRKTHVTRVGSGNGVHSKTTSLVSGCGKSGLLVNIDGSAHPEDILADSERATSLEGGSGKTVNTSGKGRGGNRDS
mmetsp:Transcript_23944/g.33622  ORF Transcript_23944/g.33622 Transcript_23944/m.33622 type:complete len:524 (-) Transcript_23944:156-1727(-)